MRFISLFVTSLALCMPASAPALAEESVGSGWALSAGLFDIGQSQKAWEFGVEYRWADFQLWRLELNPVIGVTATEDSGVWVYGGFRWDVEVGERLLVTPQFAVSLYDQGDGKDLGGTVEFRSGIELAYRLTNDSRLGICLYHLSNASFYDNNPGSESLVLTYSFGR
jgi:lipid A 3-O-deacylase